MPLGRRSPECILARGLAGETVLRRQTLAGSPEWAATQRHACSWVLFRHAHRRPRPDN